MPLLSHLLRERHNGSLTPIVHGVSLNTTRIEHGAVACELGGTLLCDKRKYAKLTCSKERQKKRLLVNVYLSGA